MNLESYAKHLAFKYMSAVAIAVINKKPKDVTLEDFLKQLQTSIQNEKVEDEFIDLTVCSDDFILDMDSTDNDKMNDNNKHSEVANEQSIMEFTTTEGNMETFLQLAETETINCINKYTEVANNKSINKDMKAIETKTISIHNKNDYVKEDNNQLKKLTEDMEATEKLSDTATFRFSEFNTPVEIITKTKRKNQHKSKIKKNVTRKYNPVASIVIPKPCNNTIQLDSQATELYDVPSTQMLDSHISQTQEEEDKRFAILDKYILGVPKKKVSKIVEPNKVVEVKRYEKIQSPNIFDSQQECGQDFDMYDVCNIDSTLEDIPSVTNVEHPNQLIFSSNIVPEVDIYTQEFTNDIHNEHNYIINDNDKIYCGTQNAIEVETIVPNTMKRTCTPVTGYLEIIHNKHSEIIIENKNMIKKRKMNNNDNVIIKNNEKINKLEHTFDTDVINNIQKYLHNNDITHPQDKSTESKYQTKLVDISNNKKCSNSKVNCNTQNQFVNISQSNFEYDDISTNLDILANVSTHYNFDAFLENIKFAQQTNISESKKQHLQFKGSENNSDNNILKPTQNFYSQVTELKDDINISNKIVQQNNIQDSQKQYLQYECSRNNLDTNKLQLIETVEIEDDIEIGHETFKQNNIQDSQKQYVEFKGSRNNLDTNNFKSKEKNFSQARELEDDIEIRNDIPKQDNTQDSRKQYVEHKGNRNNLDTNKPKQKEKSYSQVIELDGDIEIRNKIPKQDNIQDSQKQYIEYKDSINNLDNNTFKPIEHFYSQDVLDDIEINNTENSIPFKIIMELNEVKTWLNKSNTICSGTDSGYKSDNQKNVLLSDEKSLNQKAISLLSFVTTQPLSASTFTVVQEISQVLGELIDVLYNEEKYPQFLDKILENVEVLLQELWNGESCGDSVISIKNNLTTRMVLLNQSLHINEYTIEKIVIILDEFQSKITKNDDLYEISSTRNIENLTHLLHILEIVLKIYLKGKNINITTQRQTQLSNDDTGFKKSSIVDIWKRKWDPNYKKDDVECGTAEKACVTIKCREVLKKIIVDCMRGYSLVSFAALQCFNYLQK